MKFRQFWGGGVLWLLKSRKHIKSFNTIGQPSGSWLERVKQEKYSKSDSVGWLALKGLEQQSEELVCLGDMKDVWHKTHSQDQD